MSNAPRPVLPPVLPANLTALVKILLSMLAGWLLHQGLITSTNTTELVDIGSALLIPLVTFGWAWLQHILDAKKLVAAAATGNPTASPSAPATLAAVRDAINNKTSPIRAKP